MDLVSTLLLLAYGSLVLELVVFPIPSEASTFQLFFRTDPNGTPPVGSSDTLTRARRRSPWRKLACYFLPTAVGVALFLIPLAAAVAPGIIDQLVPIEVLRDPAIRWLGLGVVAIGRGITFASVLQLRRARAQPSSADLQPRGLFSVSRNPGLVGMYLFYLGNCLIFPCVVLLVGFVPYVLNMHQRVLMEESHLAHSLGPAYRQYLQRVPRYLGLR